MGTLTQSLDRLFSFISINVTPRYVAHAKLTLNLILGKKQNGYSLHIISKHLCKIILVVSNYQSKSSLTFFGWIALHLLSTK